MGFCPPLPAPAALVDRGKNRSSAVALPCDRSRDLFRRDGDTHERHPGRDLFPPAGPAAAARSLEGPSQINFGCRDLGPLRYSPNYYVVRDADGQQLAYVYYENEPGRRSAAKLLTKDKARCLILGKYNCS